MMVKPQTEAALESVLRRDRLVVLAALCMVAALAWVYLAIMALDMPGMSTMNGMAMDNMAMDHNLVDPVAQLPWSGSYFVAMFVMWAVMMVGMMLPSAAPTILLFAALQRNSDPRARTYGSTVFFTAGYLAAWTLFSLVATAAQWGLSETVLLSPMMTSTTPVLGGVLFILAGVYQLTPLKNSCLSKCRSPAKFLVERRRTGPVGPFLMGTEHGAYCVGCCWMLMALLFAIGVMNLLWVAAITGFVLAEKLLPAGGLIARIGAALMISAGAILLVVR